MIKSLIVCLLLCLPALADDCQKQLSPRLREAFKEMLREDWTPKKTTVLSEPERNDLRNLWQILQGIPLIPGKSPVSLPTIPETTAPCPAWLES